jgi:hypothetical protein
LRIAIASAITLNDASCAAEEVRVGPCGAAFGLMANVAERQVAAMAS